MFQSEDRLFSVKELLSRNGGPLPMSRSAVYTGIKNKTIPSVTLGGRVMIPGWFIKEIMEKK